MQGHFDAQLALQQRLHLLDERLVAILDLHRYLQCTLRVHQADVLAQELRHLVQQRPQGLREEVDALDLDHVVAAAHEAFDAPQVEAEAGGALALHADIMGVEADDGIDVVLEQAGANHVALAAGRHGLAAVDVQQLQVVGVLHDIQAVLVGTLPGDDAGVAHAVPIEAIRPAPEFRQQSLVPAPHLAAQQAHGDVPANGHALRRRHLGQPLEVVSEADQHRGAEIPHYFHLAHRGGFNAGPRRQEDGVGPMQHRLADVVAAVDHAVAVNGVNQIAAAQPLQPVHAAKQ